MNTLPRAISSLVVASHLISVSGQAVAATCQTFTAPVNDAKGYWYTATIENCDYSPPRDITVGSYAPSPGEKIISSLGRNHALDKGFSPRPASPLFRAVPNRAYVISDTDRWGLYSVSSGDWKTEYSWNTLGQALPFVPTRFYDLGKMPSGARFIAYGDLNILPSKAAEAYPLNRDSIIIFMNGISFKNENAILGLLAAPWSPDFVKSRLQEIVYIQKYEQPTVYRRAFIPIFPRASVAREWEAASSDLGARLLASDQPALRDKAGHYIALAGALLAVGAVIAAANSLGGSERSRGGTRNPDDRNRRPEADKPTETAPAPSDLGSQVSPFYDAPNWGFKTPR